MELFDAPGFLVKSMRLMTLVIVTGGVQPLSQRHDSGRSPPARGVGEFSSRDPATCYGLATFWCRLATEAMVRSASPSLWGVDSGRSPGCLWAAVLQHYVRTAGAPG